MNVNKIETTSYIKDWLKIIFKNPIVFINILGNIILFIPLGFILVRSNPNNHNNNLDYFKTYLISNIIIVFLETSQFLLKLGVFDIFDILLNSIGALIGILVKRNGDKNHEK